MLAYIYMLLTLAYMLLTLAMAGFALWKSAMYPGIAGLIGPTLCWSAASGLKGSLMLGTSRQRLAGMAGARVRRCRRRNHLSPRATRQGSSVREFTGVTWCLVGLVVGWIGIEPTTRA